MSGRSPAPDDDMREAYDFTAGVRGRYAERFAEGSNVVVLDPDVAALFPTSEIVNRVLREAARQERADPATP